MKTLTLLAIAAFAFQVPAFAQQESRFELGLGYSMAMIDTSNFVDENASLHFNDAIGFTVGAEYFINPAFGVRASYSKLEEDAALKFHDTAPASFSAGEFTYSPMTATLRLHSPLTDRLDAFAGAGVVFTSFDELASDELADLEIESIEIEDEIGLMVEIGARYAFTSRFGVSLEASYAPVEAESTATFTDGAVGTADLEINPVTFTGSVSFRF